MRKLFKLLDVVFKRMKHHVRIEDKQETGSNEETTGCQNSSEFFKEKEVDFITPMVFDRLGSEVGLFEMKYLIRLPLNGDPPVFSPGNRQCFEQLFVHN